jgi:hypothetical protein
MPDVYTHSPWVLKGALIKLEKVFQLIIQNNYWFSD